MPGDPILSPSPLVTQETISFIAPANTLWTFSHLQTCDGTEPARRVRVPDSAPPFS